MHVMMTHIGAFRQHWLRSLRHPGEPALWESLASERRHENVVWLVLGSVCLALAVISFAWPLFRG